MVLLASFMSLLEAKKYLIVLDDVWTNNLWTQIEEALPDENNGSRVLLTTRSYNVAKHADPTRDPYELELLTKELSLELLLKKALPYQDPTNIANYNLFNYNLTRLTDSIKTLISDK
ncbi:putative disease resistance protein [Carex littledalei]|uniref:Putative disease resistance protein n=1 Tax=Carex littledalei TaxID=544730 RepID=A0A833QHL7_9POAL|nr:putative disease resistance protein [Carex littledalei]